MSEYLDTTWFWWALALALFAAEALLPGVFLLWLGFAAAGVGLLTLVFGDLPMIGQWVAFGLLALVSMAIGWRLRLRYKDAPTDHPKLNRRAEQYLGQVVTLESAIINGSGRARVGDTVWAVTGPDLAARSRVRVVGSDGSRLSVEPAD